MMKRNKLLFGLVFMFLIVLSSVMGVKILDINANPTVTSNTIFYGTPIGGNDSNGRYIDFDGSTDYLSVSGISGVVSFSCTIINSSGIFNLTTNCPVYNNSGTYEIGKTGAASFYSDKIVKFNFLDGSSSSLYELNATALTDWSGSGNHAIIGVSGKRLKYISDSAQTWEFDGTSKHIDFGNKFNIDASNNFTFGFWINTTLASTQFLATKRKGSGGNTGYELFIASGRVDGYFYDGTGAVALSDDGATINDGNYHYIAYVINRGNNTISRYVDGVRTGSIDDISGLGDTTSALNNFHIGARDDLAGSFLNADVSQFQIYDEVLYSSNLTEIYNNGAFYNEYIVQPTTEDRYTETITFQEQVGNISVNSPSYVTVFSGTVEILENQTLTEATVAFNVEYSSSNTATCRILINGTDKNSEASRTGTAGSVGNFYLQSEAYNLTPDNYTAELQCKKVGGSEFTIYNGEAIAHFDKTTEGDTVRYTFFNSTISISSTNYTKISLLNSTTGSYNGTEGKISLAYDIDSIWNYASTGNLSFYGQILAPNGTVLANGSTFERYGTSGSLGSGGLFFLARDLPQNFSYEVAIQAKSTTGDGTIEFKGVEKEFFMPLTELFENDLDDINFTGQNWTNISTGYVDTTSYGTSDIVIKSSISAKQINGTIPNTLEFRYLVDGVAHGMTERGFTALNQAGIIALIHAVPSTGTNASVTLQARMTQNNGSTVNIIGGNFLAYLAGDIALEDLTYNVTALDIVSNTSIQDFAVVLDAGITFNSVNGTTVVTPQSAFENFTVISNNYFNYSVVNHGVTNDIQVNMTPYLQFNFTATNLVDNSSIQNFTINCSTYAAANTTNSWLYYQLSDNANLTQITCFFDADGYAHTTFNVTGLNYSIINNYTVEVYTTNSVYIYYRDAITKTLLTNVTLELISDEYSASYDLGSNSSIYLDLLAPVTYELRSTKDGYDTGFYSFTLTNRSFNNITIYLTNGTTEVTALVTDQYNNPLEGAIIKTLKYDIDTNSYLLQSIRTANFEGTAVLNIFLNQEYYRFIIEYPSGTIVKTTEPTYITETTITFKVNIGEEILEDYYSTQKVVSSLVFNELTNNFKFTFVDTENTASQGCLLVYEVTYTGNTLINTTCVSASSGTILINIDNSTGKEYLAKSYVYFGSDVFFLEELSKSFDDDPDFGLLGIFVLFILTFATIFFLSDAPKLIPAIAPIWFAMFSIIGIIAIPQTIGISIWITGILISIWINR